jgi:hypothetical protein
LPLEKKIPLPPAHLCPTPQKKTKVFLPAFCLSMLEAMHEGKVAFLDQKD